MEFFQAKTGVALKLHELTKKIVSDCGYALYNDEYVAGSSTLRVFIMDEKSKTAVIEDCIKVDRAFNPYCEEFEWIPNDFVLEVSSPGVYRGLKTKDHFKMAENEFIQLSIAGELQVPSGVTLSKAVRKNKKLRALLIKVEDEKIIVEIEEQKLEIAFSQIKKANLDPDMK